MHVIFSESGEAARVVTNEYYEKGDIIQLDCGFFLVVHRGIHLRRWAYYTRRATWFEVFARRIFNFWRRLFA